MFLYRQKTRSTATIMVTDDREAAIARAKVFVGEHNDVDGCSSPRSERELPSGYYSTWRSTSFGMRHATVLPVTLNELAALD